MNTPQLLQDFTSLPPEAQKQVTDFVAFLKVRYGTIPSKKTKLGKLADEPFVGMWKDREDMQDSTKWVRGLRRNDWGHGR